MTSPQMQLALWLMQPPIQAATAYFLYRRRLHKEFPALFAYMVVQLLVFCVQLPVYFYGGWTLKFDVFWASAAVNLVLAFRIIHEVFLDVFKPYHALKDLRTALFKWAAIIMVLVSVVLISVSPSFNDPVPGSILVVQRCVQVVQCGLVIFLLAFCSNLGIHWRRLSFGIALGFGFISGSELITTALFSGGRLRAPTLQLVVLFAYNVGMLILLLYSLMNRRRDMVPVLVPQRWDEALADIHAPQSETDSLIPMFEHMVDQALSKTNNTHA